MATRSSDALPPTPARRETLPKRTRGTGRDSLYVHRLGMLSFLPAIAATGLAIHAAYAPGETASSMRSGVGWAVLMATFLLLLFFGRHLMSNPAVGGAGRVVWGIAFLGAAPISLPLYWLAYVRPLRPHEPGR